MTMASLRSPTVLSRPIMTGKELVSPKMKQNSVTVSVAMVDEMEIGGGVGPEEEAGSSDDDDGRAACKAMSHRWHICSEQ